MSSAEGSSGSSNPGFTPPPQRLHEALGFPPLEEDPVWPTTYQAIHDYGLRNPRFIRSGSYGCILKAEDPKARCFRAVKVTLDPHSEPSAKAFKKEVSAMGGDGLPGCVCRYYWDRDSPDKSFQPFLILEWIDGRTIDKHVDGLTMDARVNLVPDFLEALASVHAHGMSLGDCSPGNTMVDKRGRVRFVDLGQSGDLHATKRSVNSVVQRGYTGTPYYASPSRMEGNQSRECDEMHAATGVVFTILTTEVPPDIDQWCERLEARGVPRPLALMVTEARRRAAAEAATAGPVTGGTGSAKKLAIAAREWIIASKRSRSLSRWRAALLVIAISGAIGLTQIWQLYGNAVLSELWQNAESLRRRIDVMPNRAHRAVAATIAAAEQERVASLEDAGSSQSAMEASHRRFLSALQRVLELGNEVAALEPLLDCIGSVLETTPWLSPTSGMRERQAEISRKYLRLRAALDRGDVKGVWEGARLVQVELAQFSKDNAAAGRALRVRSDYQVLERTASVALRNTPAWIECKARAEEAERLFGSGQFEDRGAPGAYQEYSQALVALRALMGSQSTNDDGGSGDAVALSYVSELNERVSMAEAKAAAAEARTRLLREQVERAEAAPDSSSRGAQSMARPGEVGAELSRQHIAEPEAASAVRGAESAGRPGVEGAAGTGAVDLGADRFVNSVGMTMIRIGAKSYTMGSPENEADRDKDEEQRQVSVEQHWMSAMETTQAQWVKVMASTPWAGRPHVAKGDRFPAVWVDWDMVRQFLGRLTQHEVSTGAIERDFEYRLPMEVEWELAARAGCSGSYCFGEDRAQLGRYAWYDGNRTGDHAAEVATRLPNDWGLYDCHGNVLEWCADSVVMIGGSVQSRSTDGSMNHLPVMKAVRGGSFFLGDGVASECRSASRRAMDASAAHPYLGFRAVLARKK